MNVPLLTASALGLFTLYEMKRGSTATELASSAQMPCNERWCPPDYYTIHVDKPVETVLRNDTLGGGTLRGTYQYVKQQYLKEAMEHPGVNLVAHTVI
jgi:hypothetical protein